MQQWPRQMGYPSEQSLRQVDDLSASRTPSPLPCRLHWSGDTFVEADSTASIDAKDTLGWGLVHNACD
jgi:hypothetical protein